MKSKKIKQKIVATLVRMAPFILCVVTTFLWLLYKFSMGSFLEKPALSFAQLTGLWGIALLSWDLVLAARFNFIDDAIGGLDQAYKQHKYTGIFAFVFMLSHPLMLIIHAFPNWHTITYYILPSDVATYNWGLFALWVFTLLIILTLFVKLPYHIWIITHRLMNLPFLAVAIHVLTVRADAAYYFPIRIWMILLVVIGIVSLIYKQILYDRWVSKYTYKVKEIIKKDDVSELYLVPKDKRMHFQPGQFIFIEIHNSNLPKEDHPFSISSSPNDETIRLSIKHLGDYTSKLELVKPGDDVEVHGPYGQLNKEYFRDRKDFVMVAGGIGVAPFLSLINSDKERGKKDIDLFYCTSDMKEALYDKELKELDKKLPNFDYHSHCSKEKGRISAEAIQKECPNLKKRLIFLCGPTPMIRSLTQQFLDMGIPRRNIIFENFAFK